MRGRMMRVLKPPGAFNIYSDGVLSLARPTINESELTVIALEQSFVRDVAEETKQASRRISGRLGMPDRSISSLIRLLAPEARSGGPSGALRRPSEARVDAEAALARSESRNRPCSASHSVGVRSPPCIRHDGSRPGKRPKPRRTRQGEWLQPESFSKTVSRDDGGDAPPISSASSNQSCSVYDPAS